ncbi:hypothetical protein WJX82_004884 [Trebouxia sp. C0006]
MNRSRIIVKVVGADVTCRDNKTYINPPKTAKEILERLQASGYVGDLQSYAGASLSGDDLLDDKQEYTLELAPEGVGQGRALLLSESGKAILGKSVLLVMVNGLAVGGGFFYLPGKAVTADHTLPASHRKGSELTIRTAEKTLQMEIGTCSKNCNCGIIPNVNCGKPETSIAQLLHSATSSGGAKATVQQPLRAGHSLASCVAAWCMHESRS